MIEEFKVNYTEKEISLIYQKVKDYPWDSVKNLDGWEHGTNKKYLNFMLQILSDRFGQLNKKKFINYVLTLPFFLSLIDWGVTSTSSSSSINSKACSNVCLM